MSHTSAFIPLAQVKPEECLKEHLRQAMTNATLPATKGIRPSTAKCVGFLLINHMTQHAPGEFSWDRLTLNQIARESGLSRRHVQRILRYFERTIGILRTTLRAWQTSVYQILPANLIKLGQWGKDLTRKVRAHHRGRPVAVRDIHEAAAQRRDPVPEDVLDRLGIPPEEWRTLEPGTIFELAFREWPHMRMNRELGQRRFNGTPGVTLSSWARDCEILAEGIRQGTTPTCRAIASGQRDPRRGRVWAAALRELREALDLPHATTPAPDAPLSIDVGTGAPPRDPERAWARVFEGLAPLMRERFGDGRTQVVRIADGRLIVQVVTTRYDAELLARELAGAAVPVRVTFR